MFGNSDGKAKGYTLNYYYYYYCYINSKTRKKLLHFNKRFDSKIYFPRLHHCRAFVDSKKKKKPIIEILRCNLSPYCNRL